MDALKFSISAEQMSDDGWTQDDYGRILTARGRPIQKIGYVTAIRKIIAIAEGAKPTAPQKRTDDKEI